MNLIEVICVNFSVVHGRGFELECDSFFSLIFSKHVANQA
jgi:hypothetical protein